MVNFYNRMKDTRKDNDSSQREIADILGITQQQYQLYESGKRYIPVDLLTKFCKHYQVSADYILGLNKGLRWPREEKAQHRIDLTKYDFLLRSRTPWALRA